MVFPRQHNDGSRYYCILNMNKLCLLVSNTLHTTLTISVIKNANKQLKSFKTQNGVISTATKGQKQFADL